MPGILVALAKLISKENHPPAYQNQEFIIRCSTADCFTLQLEGIYFFKKLY